MNYYKGSHANTTILLTGATGFLGSRLLRSLISEKYNVVIIKQSSSNLQRIADLIDSIKIYDNQTSLIKKCFEDQRIDIVIHTACNYGRNNESLYQIIETNELFPLVVLDCAKKNGSKCFFNTDTFWPANIDAYSLSKSHFREWVLREASGIQVINMKLEHMYGDGDNKHKFIPWFIEQLKKNVPEIKLTGGIQQRDFIFIDDVVSAFLIAIENISILEDYTEFDVGTGHPISLRAFIEKVFFEYLAIEPKCSSNLLFGSIPYRKNEIMTVVVDNSSLRHLNWNPTVSLNQGIKKILNKDFGCK